MTSAIYLHHINLQIPLQRWQFNRAEKGKAIKKEILNYRQSQPERCGPGGHFHTTTMLEPHKNRHQREEGGCRAGLHAAIVYVGKDSHETLPRQLVPVNAALAATSVRKEAAILQTDRWQFQTVPITSSNSSPTASLLNVITSDH